MDDALLVRHDGPIEWGLGGEVRKLAGGVRVGKRAGGIKRRTGVGTEQSGDDCRGLQLLRKASPKKQSCFGLKQQRRRPNALRLYSL